MFFENNYLFAVSILSLNFLFSQEFATVKYDEKEISKGLYLKYDEQGYHLYYHVPQPVEKVVETDSGFFSIIEFCSDTNAVIPIEEYDKMSDIGMPALPILSLNLNLPSTIPDAIKCSVEETGVATELKLQYPYLPAQKQEYEDQGGQFIINKDIYTKSDNYQLSENFAKLSKPFSIYGTNGVTVHISPVSYNPKENTVTIPRLIEINIHDIVLDKLVDKYSIYSLYDSWFLYDNYKPYTGIARFAIFTVPRFYNTEAMKIYELYKKNCGFDVDIYCSPTFGNRITLLDKITQVCSNPSTRPLYILLVGHYDQLPFSNGLEGNYYNPPTDYDYSHFDLKFGDEDYCLDIPIGRWPVRDLQELNNVVEKTITFEHEQYLIQDNSRRFPLFSGTGDNENLFAHDIAYIKKCFATKATIVNAYDGRKFGSLYNINPDTLLKIELSQNPWMFLYRGHGVSYRIWEPYNLGIGSINSLNEAKIMPISFLFGCLMNYEFGVNWVSSYNNKGGVSCFAPTVSIASNVNHKVSRGVFRQFEKSLQKHITLTTLITGGMAEYLKSNDNEYEEYINKTKYVLYGDPSIHIFGRKVNDWNYYASQIKSQNLSLDASFYNTFPSNSCDLNIINTTGNILNISIDNSIEKISAFVYDITGRCVAEYYDIIPNTDVNLPDDLSDGVYVIVVKKNEAVISREKIYIDN